MEEHLASQGGEGFTSLPLPAQGEADLEPASVCLVPPDITQGTQLTDFFEPGA